MIHIPPKFNDTGTVTKSDLIIKVGKWRVYKAKFIVKEIILITDHEVKKKYKHLGRITDYKFIGLEKHEKDTTD